MPRIAGITWMQVEAYLCHDNRCILPLGSTEQHAYLSLSVDSILAEKVSLEAAEPLGVPVFPVLNYGVAPYFRDFPGSISIRAQSYISIVSDILDSLAEQGFRKILIVNGHGGNRVIQNYLPEWMADSKFSDCSVRLHDWYMAPRTMAKVNEFDPVASHASWMENFPWTRLPGIAMPDEQKPEIDFDLLRTLNPQQVRQYLGDGNFGGYYQRTDEDMLAIWEVAVQETRDLLEADWGQLSSV
jgi:creatinine amidohydrolase